MIEAIAAAGARESAAPSESLASTSPSGFGAVLAQQFERVNSDLSVAETSLQRLSAGEPVELHDVMIALETARIGVQTMVQVRNRMVEAYQDLMRMQI
jgi:flagellar hook-basal body complex protein FliE